MNAAGQMRERIIAEATRLIVAHGYDGVAMREIAEAVGISKPGLYHHFRDKEDLLEAVLTHWIDTMETLMARVRLASGTREQLLTLVRGLFLQAPTQRALIRLGTQDLPRLREEIRASIRHCYRENFLEPIEAIFREGVAQGTLRPVDPHLTTWLLLGMLFPFFHTDHPCTALATEATATLIVDTLLDGIAAR